MPITTEIADHFNLNLTDHPYWSESSWFSFAIPERQINGAFYNHFRPNMHCMLAGVFMWDLTGEHAWDCLYWDWQAMRALPPGRFGVDYDKYNWQSEWGMRIATVEPMRLYDLSYVRENFTLNLRYEAACEAHAIERKTDHGLANAYNIHWEQPGQISGTIVLDGESYAVNSACLRDGSHGPRFLEVVTPGGYTWSTADKRTGWHMMSVDSDKCATLTAVGGYILRDGVMASVVSGTRRVVERIGPRPSRVVIDAVDTMGRRLHAEGRVKVPATFTPFPDRGMYWQQFAWDYDGHSGAVGEDQEYYGIQDFRRWNRAGPMEWAKR